MKFRALGNTGIELSVIGLGAWAIGGGGYRFGWGVQNDTDSISTIHRAIDMGINWIDTAPIYGDGRSEVIIGNSLKKIRDKIIISTKCGLHMAPNNENIAINLKKAALRQDIEASLKRLQTDFIDLYQIHIPSSDEDNLEAWGILESLKKEGKIRCAGLSNFDLNQLKQLHRIFPISFIQPMYNMLDTMIETEILEFCKTNHIGVIVYSPMYRGLLTGQFNNKRVQDLGDDDNRSLLDFFKEPFLTANLELVEQLRSIAHRNNKSVAHLAIAWVLRRSEITSAIVGARKPSQIEETASAGDWQIPEADMLELNELLSNHYTRLENLKSC